MPERTCIVSREQLPEADLIRFVASPDGAVVADLKRKLPGRGAWVQKRRESVAEAIKRGAFAKALNGAKPDPTLPDQVARLMRADLVQAMALARKAGLAVAGQAKVEDAIGRGQVVALVHVAGASADGMVKLNRKLPDDAAILEFFIPSELDLAFGRENVVHAALSRGGQTASLLELARGYARYESLKVKGLS